MHGTTFPMYYLELTYEAKHVDDGKLLLSFLIFLWICLLLSFTMLTLNKYPIT